MEISTRAIDVAKLALDGLMQRHQAIASNTANVMTPDYQRKDVVFEDQLQEMLAKDNVKREVRAINSAYYAHNSLDTVMPMIAIKIINRSTARPHSLDYFLAVLGSAAWEMALRISVSDITFFML